MKTLRSRLQAEIEHLTPASQKEWFRNYLKEILESDKPYYAKSDYIAKAFLELEHKIAYLSHEIQALTAYKKKLQEARALGLEITAKTLREYGIEKMEGTAISSLTITPQKTKLKEEIRIKDPDKVMELGYVKFSVDTQAIKEAIRHTELFEQLDPYIEIEHKEVTMAAKLKINKKRATSDIATDVVTIRDAA